MRTILEQLDLSAPGGFSVDREARVIRGVRFLNERSRNGYAYRRDRFADKVALYDGLPVFSPHRNPKAEPGVRELVGRTAAPTLVEGTARGIAGEVRVAPGEAGDKLLWVAEEQPDLVGGSHEAKGEFSKDGKVVEDWTPSCLAMVFSPATTRGLAESERGPGQEEGTMDLAELKAKHPALVAELRRELAEEAKASGEHAALVNERDELKDRVASLEAEKRAADMKAVAERLLKGSKMPEASKTAEVRRRLEDSKDEEAAKAYLKTVEEAVAKARAPVSEARRDAGADAEKPDAKETMRRLTGRRG